MPESTVSMICSRAQALKQMGGALRDKYEAWRMELRVCLAHAEAVIDFGDDEVCSCFSDTYGHWYVLARGHIECGTRSTP